MDKEKNTAQAEAGAIKMKGKFVQAVGRRKSATAQVRIYKTGTGIFAVNGMDADEYFAIDGQSIVRQPLKLSGNIKDINVSAVVSGGGKKGQAEAIRHGLASALLEMDIELRPGLKAKGYLTRDAREKERKKPGLKKARKAPQWSKR